MSASRSAVPEAPDETPVDQRILETIAERNGVSPLDFDTPLWDVVDPEALDALFRSEGVSGHVEFTYLGYRVRVRSDGRIALSEPNE